MKITAKPAAPAFQATDTLTWAPTNTKSSNSAKTQSFFSRA